MIDDDGNTYVDDVHGWDFSNNDNDSNPMDPLDNHGTAVAGVAAARGNNALGVSGACQQCRILPVKVFSPGAASTTAFANAIRYAATFADVINNSWGGGSPSAALQSAILFANTNGRGGKGSVVMFATGNSASGYSSFTLTGFPAGTHRFRWEYTKDATTSAGEDSAWLGWVQFPGGELVDFQNGTLPFGWTTGGSAPWSVVNDPSHSDEGGCFTHAAKAGAIADGQTTFLEIIKTVPAGFMMNNWWVSSQTGLDGLRLTVDVFNDASIDYTGTLQSGVPVIVTPVAYPAAHPESIAVGSSSNFDCRAGYSQYGPEVAFLAPSGAGPLNLRHRDDRSHGRARLRSRGTTRRPPEYRASAARRRPRPSRRASRASSSLITPASRARRSWRSCRARPTRLVRKPTPPAATTATGSAG